MTNVISATDAPAARLEQDWHWCDDLEAVNAAPGNHTVLYEDDHVRLLEVTIQPGEKEPMHGHRYPSVFAFDAPQPSLENETIDGLITSFPRELLGDVYPVCCRMGIQAPHSVKVTDSFRQHFYRLEFKKIDGCSIMNGQR